MTPLTNYDIENMLKNEKNFKGVKMSDVLPPKIEDDGLYVVNLDKQKNNGTHWVGIYNNSKNDYVFYFDSFGSPPNNDTERFLRTSGKAIKINSSALQFLRSKACGWYVIYFLKEMNKYNDPYKVLYSFDQFNSIDNELLIKKYFKL